MRLPVFIVLLAASNVALGAKSAGCGKQPPVDAGHHHKRTILSTSGGGNRSFILNIPSTYDGQTPVPLILSFHGSDRNATDQFYNSDFWKEDWNPLAISVYPQGLGNTWQGNPDLTNPPNDLAFTSDLLDSLSLDLCIDETRVYCSGKSVGGGFCNVLACDATLSARFAAIAPVSGAYYTTPANESFPADCRPAHVMPVLEFHGLNDTTIKYDGGLHQGVHLRSIPDWATRWAIANGCKGDEQTPGVEYEFGDNVTVYCYSCGENKDVVQHYAINNLAHTWPSKGWNPDNGGTGTYLDATRLIMDFFGKYALPKAIPRK